MKICSRNLEFDKDITKIDKVHFLIDLDAELRKNAPISTYYMM